jgi:drug/metabolite transporter (DMT)-like permease
MWATASGLGFGLFQSLNRRAIRGIEDPYVSTFLQLAVATVVLVVASLASEDLSRLGDASAATIGIFALAGIVHFVLGWLLLNVSQARIGAARTAPLITLTPLFGTALAVLIRGELPSAGALAAIAPIMVGAWLLASRGSGVAIERDSVFAVGTAFMWSLSAVLTVEALEGLDSPLLGVTLGLLAATIALGGALVARGSFATAVRSIARNTLALKAAAAVLVAFATWSRLLALDDADVAVVLAANLVSVPVVLVLAPALVGRHLEQVDARIWAGGALVGGGILTLIAIAG